MVEAVGQAISIRESTGGVLETGIGTSTGVAVAEAVGQTVGEVMGQVV